MISHSSLTSNEPIEEIVLDDSDEKEEEVIIERSLFSRNRTNPYKEGVVFKKRKNTVLRGLLPPEREKSYQDVINMPVVKRCCIEHSYFFRRRHRSSRYFFRKIPGYETTTVPFENKKLAEQPTIDVERSTPIVNSVSADDSSDKNNVNGRKKRNSLSSSSCNSGSGGDSSVDDSNDRDYCPDDNSTGSDTDVQSVDSSSSVKQIRKTDPPPVTLNNAPKSGVPVALNTTNAKVTSNKLFRIKFGTLRRMQKLLKSKYVGDKGKTGKVPPPRLKKMIAQRKGENMLKMPECLFPLPNLTKMANGEKNWRVEYMDDEVQSLGLDDLLLKASELNAENFTKALGRKLEPVKTNFSSKDSSEIVFTIPKTKKSAEESCENVENDASKRNNVKTIKLDISKPFFESDKTKEPEAKPPEEASPKRPGIKVKTVENINEEFKDSLGRLNGIDKEISSGSDKTSFEISMLEQEREKAVQGELQGVDEGSRPFIMTIIQGKAEKQRPAILRNSYLKKKASLEKSIPRERIQETGMECRAEGEPPCGGSSVEGQKLDENPLEKSLGRENYAGYPKVFEETDGDAIKVQEGEGRFMVKKRNIPFILNHNRKLRQGEMLSGAKTQNKLVKLNEGSDKSSSTDKTFKITSVEQKLGPKETNRRFIKVVPYEPISKSGQPVKPQEPQPQPQQQQQQQQQKVSDDEPESPQKDSRSSHLLSLTAFSAILKEILPEKWFLCLDKKHGLQIIRTQMDEQLNPSILISVVIARCGKLTVNVRGKQLSKSHELFSNLCSVANSEAKLSLNYVLAILNKLRHRSVCLGCDDPTLKKYWTEEGVVENQTEFQQVYRSHLCMLLVSLGKRRCYPCYRMNEALKKRHRREKLEEKPKEEKEKEGKEVPQEVDRPEPAPKTHLQRGGVKRHLEDFLEESFSTMKKQIMDELEKNKKLGEREKALKAQEEVLSFMGLTRKESLDNPVRKSKRKKNSFYKLQQPVKKKTDQKELEFLEKHWTDINTLFSTSLLFGAYSRTGRGRLREKCRMFQKLLSTWKNIVTSNPEWIGEISFPDEFTDGDGHSGKDGIADQFEKMDVPALRTYIINSVKEVNRIKHKLRTKNSYFKVLYNKFVKRRMKRPKSLASQKKGTGSSATSATNTPTPTDFSSDENSRDKEKAAGEGGVGCETGGEPKTNSVSDPD